MVSRLFIRKPTDADNERLLLANEGPFTGAIHGNKYGRMFELHHIICICLRQGFPVVRCSRFAVLTSCPGWERVKCLTSERSGTNDSELASLVGFKLPSTGIYAYLSC